MKYILDSHCHTLASGHAYNTIQEMALRARDLGYQALGITEHGPTIPGSCDPIYFTNYHVVDREMFGLRLFLGAEMNIVNYEGGVDLPSQKLRRIDVGIASIHPGVGSAGYPPYMPGTLRENTRAYLGAMENPDVDIIGHPDDSRLPVDYEELVRGARDNRVLLELNAASLEPCNVRSQGCSRENMKTMLRLCEKLGVYVIVSSDAHCACSLGRFDKVDEILRQTGFPEELVVNRDVSLYMSFLHRFR